MRITVTKKNIYIPFLDQGDRPAPDITDDLLSSTMVMVARGASVLFGSTDAYLHSVSMPLQNMINTGELGKIQDFQFGEEFIGKVEAVSIDISSVSIDIKLDIERPV